MGAGGDAGPASVGSESRPEHYRAAVRRCDVGAIDPIDLVGRVEEPRRRLLSLDHVRPLARAVVAVGLLVALVALAVTPEDQPVPPGSAQVGVGNSQQDAPLIGSDPGLGEMSIGSDAEPRTRAGALRNEKGSPGRPPLRVAIALSGERSKPRPTAPLDRPSAVGAASHDPKPRVREPSRSQGEERAVSDRSERRPAKPAAAPTADLTLYHLRRVKDHFYTTSPEEKQAKVEEGYQFVRIEGRAFSKQVRGTTRLHTDDGYMGYIYKERRANTMPLFYLRGPGQRARWELYTSNTKARREAEEYGWMYLGIVGYVLPP